MVPLHYWGGYAYTLKAPVFSGKQPQASQTNMGRWSRSVTGALAGRDKPLLRFLDRHA